jgi:hypothetical protein
MMSARGKSGSIFSDWQTAAMKRREEPISGLSTGLSHVMMTGILLLVASPSFVSLRLPQSALLSPPPGVAAGNLAPAALPPAVATSPGEPSEALPQVQEEWPEADVIAAKEQCMHLLSGQPLEFEYLEPIKKGECGLPAPVRLKSVGSTASKIVFTPAVDVNCRMAAALGRWAKSALQPEAKTRFKSEVVRIIGASGYSCRNIYNRPNARLSQHALANAIDIGGFVLADGRTVGVLRGWGLTERDRIAEAKAKAKARAAGKAKGETSESAGEGKSDAKSDTKSSAKGSGKKLPSQVAQASMLTGQKSLSSEKKVVQAGLLPAKAALPAKPTRDAEFLRAIHKGACGEFGTVMGPEANDPHRNHFHLDLIARRGRGYCE